MKRFFVVWDGYYDYNSLEPQILSLVEEKVRKIPNMRFSNLRVYGMESKEAYRIEIINTRTGKKVYGAPFEAIAKK